MAQEKYASPFRDDIELVPDNSILLRRIPPKFYEWTKSGLGDEKLIPIFNSGGFQDQSATKAFELYGLPGACMSVLVLHILQENGRSPESVLADFGSSHGFAQLIAGELRRMCNQGIQLNPTPEQPAHAVVFSKERPKKRNTDQVCLRELAEQLGWFIEPRSAPGTG